MKRKRKDIDWKEKGHTEGKNTKNNQFFKL